MSLEVKLTKIGIFDSGIGGFALLVELSKRLPDAEFVYYADSKNAPYGEKSEGQILALTENAFRFLKERGAMATVLACNTATAVAAKTLRQNNPDEHIFGMEPAVNEALKRIPDGKILATATPVTLKGKKFHDLLDRTGAEERTIPLPLPELVRFAERELFLNKRSESPEAEAYIREMIAATGEDKRNFSALVLGCTHFIYFTDVFRRVIDCPIFNGISGTATHLINTLWCVASNATDTYGIKPTISAESVMKRTEFYVSGEKADENALASIENCIRLLCEM